jgi:hypothetical protein
MGRFEDCTIDVTKMLEKVMDEHFRDLKDAKIKCIFDEKLKKSKGRIVLASIRKTNDLLRHLTADEAHTEEGFDYIITINKKVWEVTEDIDKERLVRHELRHAEILHDDVKDPFKIVDHDIQDFVDEVRLNVDDPGWANRVSTMILDIYEQEKEDQKAAKKEGKGKRGKALKRVR